MGRGKFDNYEQARKQAEEIRAKMKQAEDKSQRWEEVNPDEDTIPDPTDKDKRDEETEIDSREEEDLQAIFDALQAGEDDDEDPDEDRWDDRVRPNDPRWGRN